MDWMTQASTSAQKSDAVFFYSFGLSLAFLVFITALMIYFVWRYSSARHPKAEQIEGHVGLEIAWTTIPLILFLTIFYYGWTNFEYMRQAPRDSMVVKVTARQWSWAFEYPNGKHSQALIAPLDKPMKMLIQSADVVHGFYVPAFRLKIDVLPGRTANTWFQATRAGSYDLQCTVICGVNHSLMLGKVVVVPEDEFKAWYFGGADAPEPGQPPGAANARSDGSAESVALALMTAKGCVDCHTVDGKEGIGPTLKGIYGKQEEVEVDGKPRTITVDDAYLHRAIEKPLFEIVKDFPPFMPERPLEPAEVDALVSYIKGLK